MRYLAPIPLQFVDETGVPYEGGTVSVFFSGETRLANIYQNASDDELAPNPCKLDSHGMWQAFVDADVTLDYLVKDKDGNVVAPFYGVACSFGGSSVYSVEGTKGEISVSSHTTPSGEKVVTVGIDHEFKNRMEDAEEGIDNLNEDMVSVREDVDGVRNSLSGKKDKQQPFEISMPPSKTVTRFTQDEDGSVTAEFSDVEIPEGSVSRENLDLSEVEYIHADEKTIHDEQVENEHILSALDVIVTTDTPYEEVKAVVDGGKHPVLHVDGVFYRLIGAQAGSVVDSVQSVSYDFSCFPSEEVTAGERYKLKVYNLDITLGWRITKDYDFYTDYVVDDYFVKKILVYGTTNGTAASETKTVTLFHRPDVSNNIFFAAIKFDNGNTHENYVKLSMSWSTGQTTANYIFKIDDSRVKFIKSGRIYIFMLDTQQSDSSKLVGEVNETCSLELNAAGTAYNFKRNDGYEDSVPAYPYQPETNVSDTNRSTSQSFTNGTGAPLTKILSIDDVGNQGLMYSYYADTRYDFIDLTIRICGYYISDNTSSEVVTIEPYKSNGGVSYVPANLAELSHFLLLINDNTAHQFSFNVHLRMSYKEFLDRIGGRNTYLYIGFSFGSSTSSSTKHSIYFTNVWTRVTYHGDHG